jgi:hypothetical protein
MGHYRSVCPHPRADSAVIKIEMWLTAWTEVWARPTWAREMSSGKTPRENVDKECREKKRQPTKHEHEKLQRASLDITRAWPTTAWETWARKLWEAWAMWTRATQTRRPCTSDDQKFRRENEERMTRIYALSPVRSGWTLICTRPDSRNVTPLSSEDD